MRSLGIELDRMSAEEALSGGSGMGDQPPDPHKGIRYQQEHPTPFSEGRWGGS